MMTFAAQFASRHDRVPTIVKDEQEFAAALVIARFLVLTLEGPHLIRFGARRNPNSACPSGESRRAISKGWSSHLTLTAFLLTLPVEITPRSRSGGSILPGASVDRLPAWPILGTSTTDRTTAPTHPRILRHVLRTQLPALLISASQSVPGCPTRSLSNASNGDEWIVL
jgi:hypothetical protein